MNGTSMSAPFVAGAAALLRGATRGVLTSAQLKEALLKGVQPLAALKGVTTTGGMLDVAAALAEAIRMATPTPPPAHH